MTDRRPDRLPLPGPTRNPGRTPNPRCTPAVRRARGRRDGRRATALGMRESTVQAHVSRILTALEAGNRVQAALPARDAGLLR